MRLRIRNTLTRKKEAPDPVRPGRIGLYVCGPTVYDEAHMGHARSAVVFDVMVRYFRVCGHEVTHVRNFTDIDDKILRRAGELGTGFRQVAERYIRAFHRDMEELNVRPPDAEPRATEYIPHIQSVIAELMQKGHAYRRDSDVFFDLETCPAYGRLSGQRSGQMTSGIRVAADRRKRNPSDFVLWKAAAEDELGWPSPWGRGRPGWHTECVAMSRALLGERFDIHGGGEDLIFPHHENEIAQAQALSGRLPAACWVHNGMVNLNGRKMAKSSDNFLTLREVMAAYPPEAVRLFLLSRHYRRSLDFTHGAMAEATARLDRLYRLMGRSEPATWTEHDGRCAERPLWGRFCQAMNDDLNTPAAFAVLSEAMRRLNRLMNPAGGRVSGAAVQEGADAVRIAREILGLLEMVPEAYWERRRTGMRMRPCADPALVRQMVAERTEARMAEDWASADRIRARLEAMQVRIEDRPGGTVWHLQRSTGK